MPVSPFRVFPTAAWDIHTVAARTVPLGRNAVYLYMCVYMLVRHVLAGLLEALFAHSSR